MVNRNTVDERNSMSVDNSRLFGLQQLPPSTNLELGSAEGARSVGCPNRDSADMKRKEGWEGGWKRGYIIERNQFLKSTRTNNTSQYKPIVSILNPSSLHQSTSRMRNSLYAPMFEDVLVPAGGIVNYSARSNSPSTNLELGSAEGAKCTDSWKLKLSHEIAPKYPPPYLTQTSPAPETLKDLPYQITKQDKMINSA